VSKRRDENVESILLESLSPVPLRVCDQSFPHWPSEYFVEPARVVTGELSHDPPEVA
jgi:hypothetical protein